MDGYPRSAGVYRPSYKPIPGAHLVQSRPDIRLRVGTGVLRAEFRPGQRAQAGIHTRGDVLRVVAAFEREDDLAITVFLCQPDQTLRKSEKTG